MRMRWLAACSGCLLALGVLDAKDDYKLGPDSMEQPGRAQGR